MVGVAGGGVGFWPDTKSGGGGGGCCRFMARYEERGGVLSDSEERGGGGGGCCRFLARYEGRGRGGGGEYDRVSGGPRYSTVVEFMRADINTQRNRAAIL